MKWQLMKAGCNRPSAAWQAAFLEAMAPGSPRVGKISFSILWPSSRDSWLSCFCHLHPAAEVCLPTATKLMAVGFWCLRGKKCLGDHCRPWWSSAAGSPGFAPTECCVPARDCWAKWQQNIRPTNRYWWVTFSQSGVTTIYSMLLLKPPNSPDLNVFPINWGNWFPTSQGHLGN